MTKIVCSRFYRPEGTKDALYTKIWTPRVGQNWVVMEMHCHCHALHLRETWLAGQWALSKVRDKVDCSLLYPVWIICLAGQWALSKMRGKVDCSMSYPVWIIWCLSGARVLPCTHVQSYVHTYIAVVELVGTWMVESLICCYSFTLCS